ncbi:MAG: helix-turn-helix domain-containing protein [Roseburia sp.]|nr:helix-turn-helix domain-containing protein [Roseburia sp.]
MEKLYKNAGERIYLLRVMHGYTRENLAERASISSKFLYEIETGRKGFSAGVLYNISEALEVKCDYILTGEEAVNCDVQLNQMIQSFNRKQVMQINIILKQIYELCH